MNFSINNTATAFSVVLTALAGAVLWFTPTGAEARYAIYCAALLFMTALVLFPYGRFRRHA